MCKYSPNNDGLLIVEFDDDPETEGMFHSSQGFLYVDQKSKELRFRRNTLMDSMPKGLVHLERWEISDDRNEVRISTVEEDTMSGYARKVIVRRINDSQIQKTGEVVEGEERFSYEENMVRRTRKHLTP